MRNGRIRQDLETLSPDAVEFIEKDWPLWARDDQHPPHTEAGAEPWRVWMILGGRGAGKTRTGAEWVRARVTGSQSSGAQSFGALAGTVGKARRIALIGETIVDARRVMVEGVSGLLAIHRRDERPEYQAAKNQLVWPNGAVAQLFSAEDPDSLRGLSLPLKTEPSIL